MKTLLKLQFGNVYQRRAPGYTLQSRLYTNPCYFWDKELEEHASLGIEDALLEGYLLGRRPNALWLGLSQGAYRLTLTSFEPLRNHGPFTIQAAGQKLAEVRLNAGEVSQISCEVTVTGGVLKLEFIPRPAADFLLNALVVEGPEDATLRPVCASAPPVTLPSRAELQAKSQDDPRAALRRICDWLLAHRRSDGYLGDTDNNWYTASMPIRALLAGYDILGERAYLEACLMVLDTFVGEQLPNGAFCGVFRGKPTAALSSAEVEHIMEHARQPMSDIGSMVSALAIASHYAPSPHKERYLASVRHFCDHWALRFQEPSGAFTNGPWGKGWFTGIYSCATAIEAATFSLAYAISGQKHYMESAMRGIAFLLPDWQPSGRMIGRAPHWEVHNRQPFLLEPLHFGDQWYYDEGFITTARHCPDDALRTRIHEALRWRVYGEEGLLAALGNQVWWPIQDIWNNAKSIGMVQTLLYAQTHLGSSPTLDEAIAGMRRFLCTPEYARRLGIMADDRERPASVFGYQTWTGMDRQSAGFAGMTLAEMLKPGVLYLDT